MANFSDKNDSNSSKITFQVQVTMKSLKSKNPRKILSLLNHYVKTLLKVNNQTI